MKNEKLSQQEIQSLVSTSKSIKNQRSIDHFWHRSGPPRLHEPTYKVIQSNTSLLTISLAQQGSRHD